MPQTQHITSSASDVEKGASRHADHHFEADPQPGIPPQHRAYGSPVPLGLTSFGLGFFIASAFTLGAQGVRTPNVVVPVLILYGGISQTLAGWWEMFLGNTFSGTIFASYGAFNLTYGALYLPAFGVISAYQNADGSLRPEFSQAIGLYLIAWMMVTVLFIMGSLRSSGAILSTLVFTALAFLCLAIQNLAGSDAARIAGGSFGMLASACSWWGAMAGFWTKDTTYRWIKVNPVDMSPKDN